MRILVSFKVTPDYEALRKADWAAGAKSAQDGVETRYVRRILNCFDESALEMALRLRETLAKRSVASSLEAVSVGGREAETYLKTLMALGYELAARVRPQAALDFAPSTVASLIAGYVRQTDHRGTLMLGCRSGPGDSGTVPFLVAETLGWPCLTQVTEVEPLDDDRLRVTCATDGGLLRATLRTPCVLAIGNAVVSRLRVPTLKDRLTRRDEPVHLVEASDLGVDVGAERLREPCLLTSLETIDRTRDSVIVGGETARAKAQALFDGHLKTRLAKL
jgi:electron transfer flavoprotein beta subunit